MRTLSRTILGACMTVAVIAPVAATANTANAAPAPAAVSAKAKAKHFKTVQTFQKAKLGVCKVSVSNGAAWRVYGRLDTHKVRGSGKYTGALFVVQAGKDEPVAVWQSKPTKKGKYSKVGSVRLPNKADFALGGGIGAGQMGNGGPIKIARVPKC